MSTGRTRLIPLASVASMALSACGSTPPADEEAVADEPAAGYFHGQTRLYAHMVNGGGGSWVLSTVTDSGLPPADGYLVRLNDLVPAFDTRAAECEPQAYPPTHKCNPTQPFRDKNVGVVDKLISGSIAAGTAGKVTDISRTYVTTFDEPAFNKAVDEALINTGFDSARVEFIEAYERYRALVTEATRELTELKRNALARWDDTTTLPFRFEPSIRGVAAYYSGDLDLRALVAFEPDGSQRPDAAVRDFDQVLPCDAGQCLERVTTLTRRVEAELERQRETLNESAAGTDVRYSVTCEANRAQSYVLAVDCPDSVTRGAIDTAPMPLTITILARDFDALFPAIELSDDALAVTISDNVVRLTNRTSAYLTVTAETLYYNEQVATEAVGFDLAPGVTIERDITTLTSPAIAVEARYSDMTPAKAERTSVWFGYAARYRISGSDDEQTLFDRRSYTVACLIDNRLRPGSCVATMRESDGGGAARDDAER